MTKLLDWLRPKKVDIPKIKPVLLSEMEAPVTAHPELDRAVERERVTLTEEIDRQKRTTADIHRKLLTQTLDRHRQTRGAH